MNPQRNFCRSLTGFIMVEQVKSIDFRTRRAKRIERAPDELLASMLSILDACIYYNRPITLCTQTGRVAAFLAFLKFNV